MDPSASVLSKERLEAYSTAADKALEQVQGILKLKNNELTEYESLIHRLEELPKKRSAAAMAPIGSVGFLPINIVHTNEVLVGLGDGYFVDTTAYHAAEILKRRKTLVEKNIADLHDHEKTIRQQLSFAKDIFDRQKNSDEVEIREEYDEEKESELQSECSRAEMMKRLEELEKQEMQNGELDSSDGELRDDDEPDSSKKAEELSEKDIERLMADLSANVPLKSTVPSVTSTNPAPPVEAASPPLADSIELSGSGPEKMTNEAGADASAVFDGEDLIRMLTEQSEEYDEDCKSYQPPRGVSTEDYQKLLRLVEDVHTDDSDKITEEDEDDAEGADSGDRSELDSDDLSHPEDEEEECSNSNFSAQNLGPAGPLHSKIEEIPVPIESSTHKGNESAEATGSECSEPEKDRGTLAEGKNKRKTKKRKVMFAEQLEDSTFIHSQAPPSDVRRKDSAGPSQTSKSSILVNSDEKSPINMAEMSKPEEPSKVVLPGSEKAFTGVVVERNVDILANDDVPDIGDSSKKTQSLFKMKRLHNYV
ncbi:unnamed protein product [Nippostrongylus brasiliensis]|uniref:Unconventional prefoldin RPB5 interactor 1 (inferred by orthology to a human protein) n=1 Tax=Nippostrongylus brasiliensis TaxID=27835 RepID=A0A0N4Y2X4_NIPBR|nr:unnamed protein product [Nippostrongylus brasiliensis]